MKTNLDKFYKTDKDLEKEGIWFDISEDISFKMKRFGGFNSTSVKAASAKYFQPYSKLVKAGTLSEEKQNEITLRTFVSSCVIDWRGIEIDGEEKEFNEDDCVSILMELPELANTLIEYASDYNHFREDLGNS